MRGEPGDFVAETLGGDDGDFIAYFFVGVEIESKTRVELPASAPIPYPTKKRKQREGQSGQVITFSIMTREAFLTVRVRTRPCQVSSAQRVWVGGDWYHVER